MSLPPLYALRAFEVAARLNSFSKAAEALNITPGAVSRHVRTLEMWFDCELFKRQGPRVEVSDAGRVLAGQLNESFSHIEWACRAFKSESHLLRLKAPTTLTIRWLLEALKSFRDSHPRPKIEIVSVWMDIDNVDFSREPYDCAILLGNGYFGESTESRLLFDEWLIPVCAPAAVDAARQNLSRCDLIHPSQDRRDWRRWLKRTGYFPGLDMSGGKVFDTLEQGSLAALNGHGVAMADPRLISEALNNGLLALPFSEAVATGDGYYVVWPKNAARGKSIDLLLNWLSVHIPPLPSHDILYLYADKRHKY
ncbi:LysR substrate-binding domain-containing protein [Cronobacter turicensis]|uniref:LysR substrate-binding domain-containing protein n=1 Tax=Cronobacter turicensis TaxID=413502 RepID=UPI001D4408AB|nr:LysR substrate-binding domain-containing protein [Cronobacter turicensis]EGT4491681.1 LysR family transcriptional regulator [Cronobacter turicensis]EKM0436158.1 LysR family transcriptional regulator [Cronobacter turicensis]ELY4322577.1 LysR family transcriptional regulator [Cronobacter turicensis]ELY5828731.1 LysR family transcriptional regulator [Cronobacter turicensis]ELY5943113.1 LysR family transcriptional regulator [Cronobacter turicensis]